MAPMQRNRRILLLCLPLLLGISGAAGWVARETLRAHRICTARATVVSIEAALAAQRETDFSAVASTPPGASSYPEATIPPSEADRIIARLARTYTLDCPKSWDRGGPMLDPWGNRFVLYPCATPGQHASRQHAASLGPDGVWGTPDDITAMDVCHPRSAEP
jgi:hypothetical protein